MILPRRVTRSVLLSALLLAAVLIFYLLPLYQNGDQYPYSYYSYSYYGAPSSSSSSSSSSPDGQDGGPDRAVDDLAGSPVDLHLDLDLKPPSFDWSTVVFTHHIDGLDKPLPTEAPRVLPRVQAPPKAFSSPASEQSPARRDAVRAAFKRSFDAYRKHAWMRDELVPVDGGARDTFGGWAATLVDSLDTLWIMGFRGADFAEAVTAVSSLDWSRTALSAANTFETTIRHLGGLLSAHDLSGEPALLRKALELGEMLLRAFDTPTGMPPFWLDFAKAKSGKLVAGTNDVSASPCSLGLEFTRLSQLTGDPRFYAATDRVTRFLDRVQNDTSLPGMWPQTLNFRDLRADDSSYTLGAGADSLYEYFPKMHALLGGVDPVYEKLFRGSMDTAVRKLLFRPMLPGPRDHGGTQDPGQNPTQDHGRHRNAPPDVLFSGEYSIGSLTPSSQHLTCFVGGMFALGGRLFHHDPYLPLAARLSRGCGWAYAQFPTGIMPETFGTLACPSIDPDEPCAWDEDRWRRAAGDPAALPRGFTHARDKRYILRPEAIESIFVMYRTTGDAEWLDMAWDMFQSIMNATTTDLANSAIYDVTAAGPTKKMNSMESFWLAETLKYFYLIFSPPDVISLDEWVFNTEAHPFRRPQGK